MQREMFIRPNRQARSVPCPEIEYIEVPGKRAGATKRIYLEPQAPRIDNRVWESVSQVISAIAGRKLNKSFANRALYEARQYELASSMYRWLMRDFPASKPVDNMPLEALRVNGGWRDAVVKPSKLIDKEKQGSITAGLPASTYLPALPAKIPLGERYSARPQTLANKPERGMRRTMGVNARSRIVARKVDKVDYYAPVVSPLAVKIQGKG
jgi:hypothetical protein